MICRKTLQAVIIAAIVLAGVNPVVASEPAPTVRPAYCAGNWYPGDPAVLAKQVDDLLAKASPPTIAGRPIAVIAPHAGYRFSAPVAAAGYRCLQGYTYKRVIILAFSHRHSATYQGIDVPDKLTAYQTPLGEVPIDRDVCDRLLKNSLFASYPRIDRGEHSLELQLPFLQRVLKDFRLVPLLVGQMSGSDYTRAAKAILQCLDDDTLLVASSDFTHFGPNFGYQPFKEDVPEQVTGLAAQAAAPILKCDSDGFLDHLAKTQDTICGRKPISLLLRILSMQGGAQGVRPAFDTSGNIAGDWTNSVTYQSFVFTRRPGTRDEQNRDKLLSLARQTVTAYLNAQNPPSVDADNLPEALRAQGACFVTLENHGQLRVCIGNMTAIEPLYENVIHNAIAACRDHRFVHNPVTAQELDELHIEISYLTPLKRVTNPDEIIVGPHGLVIERSRRRGVLLPQVAARYGWTRDEFLTQTCRKAGLPLDAWKQPDTKIYSFEAEVFGEP